MPDVALTIAATDIEALHREAAATAVVRRNGRGGRHAGEHLIAAARAFYVRAIADGLIAPSAGSARQIAKPRRLPSARRALTPRELADIKMSREPPATTPSSTHSCSARTP
jgi:hypothetical protein